MCINTQSSRCHRVLAVIGQGFCPFALYIDNDPAIFTQGKFGFVP